MATGFFKHIPDILYDFKSDGEFHRAKDMFRTFGVWSYLQEGISGYSYYRITDGERPDVTAAKLYGDSTLYWTFFLVNENLQDFNDWPKSQVLFNKFIDRKYSGTCLVASSSTDIVDRVKKFTLGEKVSQSSSIYGFVTNVDATHNRIILNDVQGIFTAGGTATAAIRIANDGSTIPSDGIPKSFVISSVQNEEDAVHHYLDSNNQKTTVESYTSDVTNTPFDGGTTASNEGGGYYNYSTTNNTLVTNLEYEREVNEEKHLIRYIPGQYVERVIREFVNLVRD